MIIQKSQAKQNHTRSIGSNHILAPACIVFITIIFLQFLLPLPSFSFSNDSGKPWKIDADAVRYEKKTGTYIADGNVVITQEKIKLSADHVLFSTKTGKVLASGNAVMTDGIDVISGDKMEANLNTGLGTIYKGNIFFKERHFYVKAKTIQRFGEKMYSANRVSITSCDGEKPDWKITGRDLKVTIEGYGTARDAAFWIGKVPVFYTPFLAFPAKTKRQSGLLIPGIRISDRKGFQFNQPLFWAINENSDATLYLDFMQHRGLKVGTEYRYVLDGRSKGNLMFDYLNDNKVDDGKNNSSEKWGFTDDDLNRPDPDRYWFRMKHNQGGLPLELEAKLDIDVVSDQDYLLEFKKGYTGFNETKEYFLKNFGRDINDKDETVRDNSLNVSRRWLKSKFNMAAKWYDDVAARKHSSIDTTVQHLPQVTYEVSKSQLFGSRFYYDLDSEYIHFYRKDSDESNPNITGMQMHRVDLYPRLYSPIRLKRYLTIEPSAGIRHTYWNISNVEDSSLEQEDSFNRTIYDLNVKFYTEFFKIFNTSGVTFNRIKHIVRPEVSYSYTPEKDQDEIPNFTAIDRIQKANTVTYSLTNTFISKSKGPSPTEKNSSNNKENEIKSSPKYLRFLRFYLEQSYDINEANDEEIQPNEPFSPLYGEIEFTPWEYISLQADTKWNQYDKKYTERNVKAAMFDYRGDELSVRYRNTLDAIETITAGLNLKITNRISGSAGYEKNLLDNERVKLAMGVSYRAQCWSINIDYIDEMDDRTFSFNIALYGLGEISN